QREREVERLVAGDRVSRERELLAVERRLHGEDGVRVRGGERDRRALRDGAARAGGQGNQGVGAVRERDEQLERAVLADGALDRRLVDPELERAARLDVGEAPTHRDLEARLVAG